MSDTHLMNIFLISVIKIFYSSYICKNNIPMQTIKKLAFVSLIALLLGFVSCSTFRPIEVGNPKDIQVHSIQTDKIKASLFLPVKNPNLFGVRVKEIDATVFINDKKTGNVVNSETLKIPANSDKTQELKFEIDFSDIISGGMSIFKILREREVDLRLEGTITAKTLFSKREMDFIKERTIRLKD